MKKTSKKPLVSIVVLNWNGIDDTKECIKSIRKLEYPNKEIIIVDNGSSDGSKEFLRTLDDIQFVDLPENTGFTGGHIAGAKVAKGEYLAIVNNDLVLDKEWINHCLETFGRHKNAALVGGKAYKWNEDSPAYNTQNEYYSYQEVDPSSGYTRTMLLGDEECSVDSISGAALLIKRSCIDEVGYFDDDFFAYYEETDLIARMLRKGFEAYYNPLAHTWHKIAASSGNDSAFYLYMMHRNRYMYAVKNLDDRYLKVFLKTYRNESIFAYIRLFRSRKDDLDAKCRIRSYRWARKHKEEILSKRRNVMTLGDSYVDKLRSHPREDVTIIIPCYNYGKYVSEAIQSALDQTLLPKKIIVINDGSTDDSKKIIATFEDNPLVEIVNKPNTGVIDTKNLGIKMSGTYWTLFLDADDKLSGTFLEKTIAMSKNGAKDIIYTDMILFGANNDTFRAKPYSTHTLLKSNYINNSALIKTTLLKQIGGYKKEMNHGLEDWELYISLVEAGAKPQYLPLTLVKYRQHDGSLSRNNSALDNEKELIRQIKHLHRNFYRKNGYYRTVFWHALKMIAYTIRYPRLVIVLLLAIPAGLKVALSHIYGKGLIYIQKKLDLLE